MVWAALSQGVDPFSEAAATEFLTDKTAAVLSRNFQGLPWEVSYIRAASLNFVHIFCFARLWCDSG